MSTCSSRAPQSAEVAHYRAVVAGLSGHRSDDDPELVTARRELHAAMLADHIRKVVDAAPPLNPEQRAKLAVLLMMDEAAAA